MICNTCRRVLALRVRPQIRSIIIPATPNAAASNPPPISGKTPATSSATPGISQSLSTPFFPSTSTAKLADAGIREPKKSKIQSSIVGGTELKGLAYLKNKPRILAKEDDEYPAWLWTILDEGKPTDGKPAVDLASLTKKQRAKHDRKQARLLKDLPKPVPLHEQSRDLTQPGDDASISLERRQELTKSSRDARRKAIRESNFLRGV